MLFFQRVFPLTETYGKLEVIPLTITYDVYQNLSLSDNVWCLWEVFTLKITYGVYEKFSLSKMVLIACRTQGTVRLGCCSFASTGRKSRGQWSSRWPPSSSYTPVCRHNSVWNYYICARQWLGQATYHFTITTQGTNFFGSIIRLVIINEFAKTRILPDTALL